VLTTSLKVAYFSNQFADRQGHGLARYARELYAAIGALGAECELLPVAAWSSMPAGELAAFRRHTGLRLLPWGRRATPLAWSLFDRPRLEHWLGEPVDLVHAVALGYPLATRKPYVVTVHDIGPLSHPRYFPARIRWIMARSLAQAVARADALICVSQATAGEVLERAGSVLAKRITVIPEGVSENFFKPATPAALPAPAKRLTDSGIPFLLATGKISPRKNTLGVIEALEWLSEDIPHHLVLAGGQGWHTRAVRERLARSHVAERLHLLGFVAEPELRALYGAAAAFVHPSLFEGFGLPVLEAMAAGCPVITSNCSSLPEVAGEAALLVDPADREALAGAILSVCRDEVLARRLHEHGRRRARQFTWSQCARGVLDVYRQVV